MSNRENKNNQNLKISNLESHQQRNQKKSKLNQNKNFLSNYYHNDLAQNKENFIFLKSSKILNQSIFDIYLKYKADDVANFCFFYEGIKNEKDLENLEKYDIIHLHWINYFLNL